jgi:PPM family protein phosphatase
MKAKFSLLAAAGTDPGRARSINQDHVLAYVRPSEMGEALGLFVVADGMGGHQAGEVASRLAVDTIRNSLAWMLEQDDLAATRPMVPIQENGEEEELSTTAHLERRLELAVAEANQAIFNYAQENPVDAGNLGCTVTCAIIYGSDAVVANVGDSRTYLLSQGSLIQITDDHSYVGQLVREGHLHSDEIFDHPQRNVITRALGNQPQVRADIWSHSLAVGDRLLLCSDGVWEMIRDADEIAGKLQAEELETAVQQLVDAANGYGGADNIGVVVAELQAARSTDS